MSKRTFSSGLSSTNKAYKSKSHSLIDWCGTLDSLTKSLVLYTDIKIFTKIIHLLSYQFSNLGSTVHHMSIYQSNSVEKWLENLCQWYLFKSILLNDESNDMFFIFSDEDESNDIVYL